MVSYTSLADVISIFILFMISLNQIVDKPENAVIFLWSSCTSTLLVVILILKCCYAVKVVERITICYRMIFTFLIALTALWNSIGFRAILATPVDSSSGVSICCDLLFLGLQVYIFFFLFRTLIWMNTELIVNNDINNDRDERLVEDVVFVEVPQIQETLEEVEILPGVIFKVKKGLLTDLYTKTVYKPVNILRKKLKRLKNDLILLPMVSFEKYLIKEYFTSDVQTKSSDEVCTMCFCEIEEGDEKTTIQCSHSYHFQCICDWYAVKPICPLCLEGFRSTLQERHKENIKRPCKIENEQLV